MAYAIRNKAKLVLSELTFGVLYLIFPALRSEEQMASPPVLRSLRFGNRFVDIFVYNAKIPFGIGVVAKW